MVFAAAEAGAALAPALKDFTGPGVAFFNNLRVPAALLAASAIKDAFVLQGARGEGADSRVWRVVRYAYLLLMISAFAMEIGAIFLATHVGIQLGAENFNARAGTLVDMLVREFEFEYVAVRAQFISGLLAYVLAQGLRVRFALRKYSDLAWAATFCLFSAAGRMLSYHNAHAISYGGYPGLVYRWAVLSTRFFREHASARRPVVSLTIAMSALAAVFGLRAVGSAVRAMLSELATEIEESDEEHRYHDAYHRLREIQTSLATDLRTSMGEFKRLVAPRETSGWPPRPTAVVPGVTKAGGGGRGA